MDTTKIDKEVCGTVSKEDPTGLDLAWQFCLDCRKLVRKEAVLKNKLIDLYEDWDKSDDETREILTLKSMCLYDLFCNRVGNKAAAECAFLLPDFPNDTGRSWTEGVYEYIRRKQGGPMTTSIAVEAEEEGELLPSSFQRYLGPAKGILLNKEEDIACYRNVDGSIVLILLDFNIDSVLCDEETFNDNPPLYFTPNTHFLSPVYKLKIFRQVMTEVFSAYHYPFVPVQLKVIFTSNSLSLVNDLDMVDVWKEMNAEVIAVSKRCVNFPLSHLKSSFGFPKPLQTLLELSSKIYRRLPFEELFSDEYIRELISVLSKKYPLQL